MSIKTALYTYLSTQSAITGVVSTKVYPGRAPTGASLPYITYSKLAEPPYHNFGGADIIANPTFEFECWANSDVTAESLMEALRNVLDGFRGTMATVDVRNIIMSSVDEDYTAPDDGSEQGIFRISADFEIWYVRSVPNALNPS
jgi:hypothetical protein